jgi:hypothetical protein
MHVMNLQEGTILLAAARGRDAADRWHGRARKPGPTQARFSRLALQYERQFALRPTPGATVKLRRRQQRPPPVLGEDAILLLLLGMDPPTRSAVRRLLFTAEGNYRRVAELWREHEDACLREAKRRGITRPHDADLGRPAFFAERACEMMTRASGSPTAVADHGDCALRFAAIERRLSQLERRPVLSDDAAFLDRALPVIGGAFGSTLFTVEDLLDARAESEALRQALDRSASSVRQVFARNNGHAVAGFVIEKVGRTGSRAVWKVLKVEPG